MFMAISVWCRLKFVINLWALNPFHFYHSTLPNHYAMIKAHWARVLGFALETGSFFYRIYLKSWNIDDSPPIMHEK